MKLDRKQTKMWEQTFKIIQLDKEINYFWETDFIILFQATLEMLKLFILSTNEIKFICF